MYYIKKNLSAYVFAVVTVAEVADISSSHIGGGGTGSTPIGGGGGTPLNI